MASANITQLIADAATSAGVDPNLAIELAITESSLNQNARGAAGEIGVMQILPSTAPGVNLADLTTNITFGVGLLASLIAQFGDPVMGVAAYNCGAGCVSNAVSRGGSNWLAFVPSSTQAYVAKIFGALPSYSAALGPASSVADVAGDTEDAMATVTDSFAAASAVASSIDWSSPATWAVAAGIGLVGFFLLKDILADA